MLGAKALEGALSRLRKAPSNSLSDSESRLVSAADFDNEGFENEWSNDNPDSWPYPECH